MHSFRFPAETPQYRAARNELLEAERRLRGEMEHVAAMRRGLPMGGLVPRGGAQNSILHVFAKRPDGVRHFWSTELNLLPAEPGQNHRHIDTMWPLWNVLDTTPEGRGADWYPEISYD